MAVSVTRGPAEQLPPQNLEAETSVLGAILLAEGALDGVILGVRLQAEDFYRERHRLIFASMLRLKSKAESAPIDVLTVCEDLDRHGQLEEAGGEAYVHELPGTVPAAGNAAHYAGIVKERSQRRKLLDVARRLQDQVFTSPDDADELIQSAEAAVYRVSQEDRAGDLRSIEAVLHDELDKLERVSKEGKSVTGTPSGFGDLDELTGGFQPGNLIVLAARPAMGKSALVTNIAENAAVQHGRAVALFSLEMAETELAQRFIASQAKLDGDALRKGRVKADRWPKVVRATETLARAPLYIDDTSDLGIMEIRSKARHLHARAPLGLIVVDYLQLMRPDTKYDSLVAQVGQMSRGLKVLARELNVPVIAVSQLSRGVESRPDKRPLLSDLRESGQIEQDADLVMFIYRDEYYNRDSERPGEADVIIAKHRNGPVGDVTLTFLSRYPKFANVYKRREDTVPLAAAAGDGEE